MKKIFPQPLFGLSHQVDHSEDVMQLAALDTHGFVKQLAKVDIPE